MDGYSEKRKHTRREVDYKYFAAGRDTSFSGMCRDISPYGAGIISNQPLNLDDQIDIRIVIPQENIDIKASGKVRHCFESYGSEGKSSMHLIGVEFSEGALDDIYATKAPGQESRYTPAHTIKINVDAKFCYKTLGDFPKYPQWASGIEDAKVLERYPDGRAKRVEFLHDFFLRKIRYVLDYFYDDEKNILSWLSAGGDEEIIGISGAYTFKPKGDNQCYATYELDITLSIIPSNRLVQYVTVVLMRKEMKNFRKFAEKQAGTALN